MPSAKLVTVSCATALATLAGAVQLDVDSPDSIKQAAKTIALEMMSYYTGDEYGQTPGLLPGNGQTCDTCYYWWEAGAMFGSLIDYWYLTGDTYFNDLTTQALLFQVGEYKDYEPANETLSLGNDDQAFWAMAAMTAAESKYPNPPPDQPQWLPLAQAVWNRQMPRWDTQFCGGGFRWQFFPTNAGYNYKNTISNGCFFSLSARLGKYTGNQTYLDWAEKAWDWTNTIGLIDSDFRVFDGTGIEDNCTTVNHLQWSYNVGVFLHGAAAMWNATQSDVWKQRVNNMISGTNAFFDNNDIMVEIACENIGTCNVDQRSFKAYLSRWMGEAAKIAPFTYDAVMRRLRPSAKAAAAQCVGGANGTTCGLKWTTNGVWDGSNGVGQQMAALEVIQTLLIDQTGGPVNLTDGISQSDPSAGTYNPSDPNLVPLKPLHVADRAGAGILTILFGTATIAGAVYMAM